MLAEVRSSGGLLPYALALEMHHEEAERLDLPRAFYTDAQTIDDLQGQVRQINAG